MELDTRAAVTQRAPSYRRATAMQAPLVLASTLAGLAVWLMGAGVMWLSAAVVIGAVIPFTLIAIMPTDHLLVESGRDLASSDTRMLLQRWGRLHAVRTALGTVGAVLYVRQLLAG